ncbi:hypothetical protein [Niveispirillum sp. KHB5.9]|uniref:hypothetical protein n=1 Tax=Niveispirillum sp. KHB5.9 TaxID=3400269 RepID=UPI003A8B57ED
MAAPADDVADSFGDPTLPGVTLAVPVIPTIVDSKGLLVPAMRAWLGRVAAGANIHLKIQAANFDRRSADMARSADHCVLGYARLPAREDKARWLAPVRRDRMIFVARHDDPFQGGLDAFMKAADGKVAAPSGVYREALAQRGVEYVAIDDQRALARMVEAGRVRFGMLIAGSLNAPEVQAMQLRVVAEMPPQEFWFACSPLMPDSVAVSLTRALRDGHTEALRRLAMAETPAEERTPTQ